MPRTLRIGTRGSTLALWQANWVKSRLEAIHPGLTAELSVIRTTGDKILDVPLAGVGGKGLFVKEIEEALCDGRIDLAVHSMKDMPSEIPAGLCIGAVTERESPADVLISRNGEPLSDLEPGARIGTSSLRRAAQLRYFRSDLCILPLRGNLDTRLRKLASESLDAVVLAAAGVKRLGLESRITQYLDPSVMLPAVGQGALCVEIRAADPDMEKLVSALDHPETHTAVSAERSFLNRLEGSCQVPIAGLGRIDGPRCTLEGLVSDPAGRTVVRDSISGDATHPDAIGIELAQRLLSMGAGIILEHLKAHSHDR